ncbi:MAG: sulfur carrier protein ThiS [Sulfurovum sp.]|nr:sulfur carrier protein ThiS [Sulfurovaceae bacterium]
MKIKVNGEIKEYQDSLTLDELINNLGIRDKVMASAVNMEIVKKDNWNSCILKDGDIVELLDFVGGG